jgi:hypothetical protein
MIKIAYVTAEDIHDGSHVVEAKTADGRWFQHQGPKNADLFTAEQAWSLVRRVRAAGQIDPQFWTDGQGGYGTEDHEYYLIEAEYYEG